MDINIEGKGKEKILNLDLNEDLNEDFEFEDVNVDVHISEDDTSFPELSIKDWRALEFNCNEEAYNFYVSYAKSKGFSIRKSSIQYNKDGIVRLQIFVCSREGQRAKAKDQFSDPKREIRGESRVNCGAHMRIKYDKKKEKHIVAAFVDDHSHDMILPQHVMFLRSQRSVNAADMNEARAMHRVGISASKIMDVMVQKHQGYENCGFLQKDLSNALHGDYKEEMKSGDAEAALAYLSGKADSDPSYYYKYKCDDGDSLDMLFWSDGKSRMDYAAFGDVLAFDTTYRTNIYNRPFVMLVGVNNHYQTIMYGCALLPNKLETTYIWVLETFLDAMNGKQPGAVITDGDKAMRAAILAVFPGATHRLCKWHIQRNVFTNIHIKAFLGDFTALMDDPCTPDEFEQAWIMLLESYELQNNKWLPKLYSTRKLWAQSYLKGKFFAMMTTTGRCEGFNGYFNTYLNKKSRLFTFVRSFDRGLVKIRHNETAKLFNDEATFPLLSTKLPELEGHAAEVYTRRIFVKVREEIKSTIQVIQVQTLMNSDGTFLYYMSMYNNPNSTWIIRFNEREMSMKCSCLFFETVGLPCVHTFQVMKIKRMKKIPHSLIKNRWTKNASDSSSMNLVSVDAHAAKVQALTSICNKMIFFASHSTTGLDVATKEVEQMSSRMEALYLRNQQEGNNEEKVNKSKFGVRDPGFVTTKENPGSKKYKKLNKCGICRSPNHMRNNCPKYELPSAEKSIPSGTNEYTACKSSNVMDEFEFHPQGLMASQETGPSIECDFDPHTLNNQESPSSFSRSIWDQSDIATIRNAYH